MKQVVGYSGTPLAKKLGIVEGSRVLVENAPANYVAMLEPTPAGVTFVPALAETTDVVHVFAESRVVLAASLARLRPSIRPNAAVWVSWPKKSSKVPTDISEDSIREVALPLGFVDIKVCAVSEIWSGLKLVIRKELRS